MSNYLFLNHQSPVSKRRPEFVPSIKVSRAISVRPRSIKTTREQPSGILNSDLRKNVQSPETIENSSLQKKNQYNYHMVPSHKKEQAGPMKETNASHAYHSRDSSPLGRVMWHNEPARYFPVNLEIEQRAYGERDGSWDRLLKRSEEQVLDKNQKLMEWRRYLEEQVKERRLRKQEADEKRKNEEFQAESRYRRQIEELSRDLDFRKNKNQSLINEDHYPESLYPIITHNSQISKANVISHKNPLNSRENQEREESRENNLRAKRVKGLQREENYSWNGRSGEKDNPKVKKDPIIQSIANLKDEILQSQKTFKNEINNLANEVYKSTRIRNVPRKSSFTGIQKTGFIQAGAASLPIKNIYDNLAENTLNNYMWKLLREKQGREIVRPIRNNSKNVSMMKYEDKLQWDNEDFYVGLNDYNQNNTCLIEVQTMVKIQPVTEDLLAYKKPEKEILKTLEDREKCVNGSFADKHSLTSKDNQKDKDRNKLEQTIRCKDNKYSVKPPELVKFEENEIDIQTNGMLKQKSEKLGSQGSIGDENVSFFKTEIKKLPNLVIENKDTSKTTIMTNQVQEDAMDKQGIKISSRTTDDRRETINISIMSSKNTQKNPSDEDLKINERLQEELNERMMYKEEIAAQTVSPKSVSRTSLDTRSKSKTRSREELKKHKLQIVEDRLKKELMKSKNAHISKNESGWSEEANPKAFQNENRITQKDNKAFLQKNDGSLKALTQFVSKDAIDSKLFYCSKMQKDPLARLDMMIDYLFNANTK